MEEFLVSAWPTLIVELGTGTGAFSLYFAAYAAVHGARFHTFDLGTAQHSHQSPKEGSLRAIRLLNGVAHRSDVFSAETQAIIRRHVEINEGPAFIYCDNGDKPREMETYAPMLRVGDYLGVHDYGTEVHAVPEDGFSKWHWPKFDQSTNRILERV